MANKYIAVTIGPIFDTINLASSPSALWAASYLFSMLSKNICQTLTENGVAKEEIISPYYDPDDELLNKNDGVGLFHDRIIFRAENFPIEQFNKIKDEAIDKTLGLFQFKSDDADYFKKYFLVSAVAFESDDPIPDSAKPLDCLELAKPFVEERGSNPLLTMFHSDDTNRRNEEIKNRVTQMGITDWQLFDNNRNLMSLPQIAKNHVPAKIANKFKKFRYYAVVRSDGDRMGEIIKGLKSDEEIRSFSENCLKYCSKVAEKVKEYGGVTIYSGGDDLLALIPVENSQAKTVFGFIKSVNAIFANSFKQYNVAVSLSMGVFVSYYKFPLYEALERSAELLFGTAKSFRDCAAIHFQKHAGQSEGLVIFNDSLDRIIELHSGIIGAMEEPGSEIILSAMHKLALFRAMFNNTDTDEQIQNLFNNTFDAEDHKNNNFLKKTLPRFFGDLKSSLNIYLVDDSGIKAGKDDPVLAMNYILRTIKFFAESGGEE